MRAHTIDVKCSTGKLLFTAVFRAGGKKLLGKGHVIQERDVLELETEGLKEVCVAELEDGEVSETDAATRIATEMACGALEIRPAAGGRANVFATEPGCVLVDEDLLRQINCAASSVIATARNFSYARARQRVATVKSLPFAVAKSQLEALLSILQEKGPLLQGRPIRSPLVAILYTDPENGALARQLFENTLRQRLAAVGVNAPVALTSIEEDDALAKSLYRLLMLKPALVLIASTTAPAGPKDAIGRALLRAGCEIERFLAPVEPGNLLLLGYKNDIPILSSPGCFRSIKPNVLDLMIPPMLAQYRVSAWEIASLGHGGLLS
jgi:molybdenum cofactor cytidylyltransferase